MQKWKAAVATGDQLRTEAEGSPFTVLDVRDRGIRIEAAARKVWLKPDRLDAVWERRLKVRAKIPQRGVLRSVQYAWKKAGVTLDTTNESQYWALVVRREHVQGSPVADGAYEFTEGARTLMSVSRIERNRKLRGKCIERYGATCLVCSLDFGERYPGVGDGFIHIHHLEQLADAGKRKVRVDELRPVCPNCHAMLHQRRPPFTIEELKGILLPNAEIGRNA